ncbi:MAG: PTS sugar transporter subunit IIA [Candidatus Saelkia tenebricola]|nr:PTS sugar transporter subunit IIA [Candidatus Saelkia tenebricola]
MKISQLLKKELIKLEIDSQDKESAIAELTELMRNNPEVIDADVFLQNVYEREQLGSTGVGEGIALPHARSIGIKQLVIVFGRSTQGVEFAALDANPVQLIFLIATPKNDVGNYLKTLAHLSRMLRKEYFRKKLLSVTSSDEVLKAFEEMEQET